MSVAPHAGIVDFGTFTSPNATTDGIQGEVPQPLAGQQDYVLTANGFVPGGSISGLGTMAVQNANAVAITGGTINGTTIGATTPSSIVGTTITGQTGVLRGTGQNLVTQSQTIATSPWAASTGGAGTIVTPTNNEGLAPDGTTTATRVRLNLNGGTTSSDFAWWRQNFTGVSGLQYTFSFYAKSYDGTSTYTAQIIDITNTSTAITVTGAWTRFTVTASGTGSSVSLGIRIRGGQSPTNSNAVDILMWGAQLELGSTANTYIPTTTTAVYGTPTLSFSGVSTLGLESNGALFLQPAGTGAIQAQATTSTTAGGNVRGANAVDWQTSRNGAAQVASSTQSVVGGGFGNTASNVASTVAGGASNVVNQPYGGILSGQSNSVTLNYASVVGGSSNTGSGYYGFVGGGTSNSTTSSSAVTTQSATMNGTTAVTLSGSNANIKVGQMITGTSITFPNTYVAAISGTSLTLSQAASGSSTSTLSFFTPHGVVVGGGNNQATGSYSFIGGGGDAGTAGNRNVASGDWSFVGGGIKNVASGTYSSNSGGNSNTASGQNSFIGAGFGNTSSGFSSIVGGGNSNLANSTYSAILGGFYGTSRSIQGNTVFPASVAPFGNGAGLSQSALLILGKQTTDATASALTSDGGAASGTNQVILPNNSAYYFKGSVIANVTGAANGAAWSIEGAIMRGANAASTVLIDTPSVNRVACSAGATAWVVAVTADTTNGGIAVTVTGVASTTIRWVAKLETTEVTF